MPEGDTIHRIAAALALDVVGRRVAALSLRDRGEVTELRGRRIDAVEARGKHLLVHLEGGVVLRTHLGMHGRWRRYPAGHAAPAHAGVVLATDAHVFVCRRPRQAELVRASRLRVHPALSRLGPDLLGEAVDLREIVRRARAPRRSGDRQVGVALLDQRVAAGIGNVYKSEVLFLERVSPFVTVASLSDESLRGLYARARALLLDNLAGGPRVTVPASRRGPRGPRTWVYGRAGRPCLECGTEIEHRRQGDDARSTYFCPRCQARAGDGSDEDRSHDDSDEDRPHHEGDEDRPHHEGDEDRPHHEGDEDRPHVRRRLV